MRRCARALATLLAPKLAWGFVVNSDAGARWTGRFATLEAVGVETARETVLKEIRSSASEATEWGERSELVEEVGFYGLFRGIAKGAVLGLKGTPFFLSGEEVSSATGLPPFGGYFTRSDLARAVEEDHLDASRGSVDDRRGWTVSGVSAPRSRTSMSDVEASLLKGSVIFNAIAAHVPKLAGATLACTDASSLPCAANLYVTAPGVRTSAPAHTDRQDVIVVQTEGRKRWRVYSPARPKAGADCFARGKGSDALALHDLEGRHGCELLLERVLERGDVLFVPAGFPHTTSTVVDKREDTSISITFNLDTHVWDLDYLTARSLALKRAGAKDALEGGDNLYVGKINSLPSALRSDLFDAFPLGLPYSPAKVDHVASKLETIARAVDPQTSLPADAWEETVSHLSRHGCLLLDVHRDMYLAAIQEGRRRQQGRPSDHVLAAFRASSHYEKVDAIKKDLLDWSRAGKSALPKDWEYTFPIKIGDEVEADLGGAFFPAAVTRVAGDKYDVRYFDGDQESGVPRSMLKLLTVPVLDEGGEDTSSLTPKQLKKLKKKQGKKKKVKKGF